MSKVLFISDYSNAEFGYRQAISSTIKALGNRNATGRTVGDIGKQFGRKMWNATRGKVAVVGRGIKRISRTFSGGNATKSIKASESQINRRQAAIKKFGVKNPLKPKPQQTVVSPANTTPAKTTVKVTPTMRSAKRNWVNRRKAPATTEALQAFANTMNNRRLQ